eukprot:3559776-Alexandrium_andersonii.AAC.1
MVKRPMYNKCCHSLEQPGAASSAVLQAPKHIWNMLPQAASCLEHLPALNGGAARSLNCGGPGTARSWSPKVPK